MSNPSQFGNPDTPVLGSMRYEHGDDGRLVEVSPEQCPNGHDVRPRGSMQVGYHHGHGMREYHCRECAEQGLPADWCLES